MNCEPAMAILRAAVSQWDTQCALHRLSITGDWTELDDLSTEQLTFSIGMAPEESAARPRILAILETRNASQPS